MRSRQIRVRCRPLGHPLVARIDLSPGRGILSVGIPGQGRGPRCPPCSDARAVGDSFGGARKSAANAIVRRAPASACVVSAGKEPSAAPTPTTARTRRAPRQRGAIATPTTGGPIGPPMCTTRTPIAPNRPAGTPLAILQRGTCQRLFPLEFPVFTDCLRPAAAILQRVTRGPWN